MDLTEYTVPSTKIKDFYTPLSDGIELYCIDFIPKNDSPSKPIIFFVAGWISHITGWKNVLRTLTDEYRVIYIETREKISSKIPKGKSPVDFSFTVLQMVTDLYEVIPKVIPKNRTFVMAGSSLGSSVILEYLAMKTREPECALLIGPIPEFKFPPVLGDIVPRMPASWYNVLKELVKWYLRNFRLDPVKEKEQLEKYTNTINSADPYKLKPNALALKNYNLWNKLPFVSTPCYIFGAKTDTLHATEDIKRLMQNLIKAEYIECQSNKETHSEVVAHHFKNILRKKLYKKIKSKTNNFA